MFLFRFVPGLRTASSECVHSKASVKILASVKNFVSLIYFLYVVSTDTLIIESCDRLRQVGSEIIEVISFLAVFKDALGTKRYGFHRHGDPYTMFVLS